MNRIYKSVWNAVTRSWTAVSEWKKARGKHSHNRTKTIVTLASTLIVPSTVFAYGNLFGEIDLSPFYIGNNSQNVLEEGFTGLYDVGGVGDHHKLNHFLTF